MTTTAVKVKVHPTAVLAIVNNYIRRSDKSQRVIGTLLGSVKDNVVEVSAYLLNFIRVAAGVLIACLSLL
jgi:hypothetical protein